MPNPKIELYLLGNPELRQAGHSLNFDTRKALALLAYLVVSASSQSRNTLAALLWGELDQTNARASLRRTLSTLNKGLEGTGLEIERETIGLAAENGLLWSDVTEFTRSLKTGKSNLAKNEVLTPVVVSNLEQTVSLWRGEFMQGFSLRDAPEFEEWQCQVAESLRQDMVWALEKLVQWYSSTHAFDKALDFSRRWLALDSLNEIAHQQLMKLYAWKGQPSLALKQYQECAQILERELGVSPLETTTAVYEAIKEHQLELPPLEPSQSRTTLSSNSKSTLLALSGQLAGTDLPLLGRETEWQELETAAGTVLHQGRGRLVLIEGEAGIGKTRLVEEFLRQQQAIGFKVTKVACYEGEAEMAFVAVSTLLRNALDQLPERSQLEKIGIEWRSEAARLLPELGTSTAVAPTSLNNPGAQLHFYEGLRQTLLAFCGTPSFIFFDDLQWIDGASLDFLSYLTRRIIDQPICLILAWRTGTLTTQARLAQLVSNAKRQNYATWLAKLTRLSLPQVEELVRIGLPDSPAELARTLYAETEGLPFFIVEYIEAYQRGLFEPAISGKEDNHSIVPGGIRDLLESRLRSIDETALQLLQSAAVIGQVFDFDTLREVSGRTETETISGLEELTSASMVMELELNNPELRYDFSHEKLRSLVYETTSPARRRLLHRRVAEAFANRRANKERLYGQIGYHYRLAGNEQTAADYYRLAGDYAGSLFANREALNHYQTALALGYPEPWLLYEAMGDLYTLVGEYKSALHQYQLALPQSGDSARLEYKIGKIYLWRGEWELCISQFEIALGLTKEEDKALAAQIRIDWSLALHHLNRNQEARTLAEKALEHGIRTLNKRVEAQAHNMLGLLVGHAGETAKAINYLEQSLSVADELGEGPLRVAALNNLARVNLAIGELEKSIKLTESALEIASVQGDRHREAALLSNLGDLYQAGGQTERARQCVRQSVSIYVEIGVESGNFQPGIWMLTDW